MKGSITASCGHTLKGDEEVVQVRYGAADCDAIDGLRPCVVYASFCPDCAKKARSWPEYIPDGVEDDWWFETGYDEWIDTARAEDAAK